VSTLAALFPAEDYRIQLGLRRGAAAEFFRPKEPGSGLRAERARLLAAFPARHAGLLPSGQGLFEATCTLLADWGLSHAGSSRSPIELGAAVEPDLLWLTPDASGEYILCGGVLCFPTSWALEDKIGRPMTFIHGPVPGLNAALGGQIGRFLAGMQPATAYFRHNWGLAATDSLNLHPAVPHPKPALPLDPNRLWLRVEHQVLLALPGGGVLFAIRIELMEITAVQNHTTAACGLSRALRSMPEAVAAYKGIAEIRFELADWLVA
jgi:hypothetical protein